MKINNTGIFCCYFSTSFRSANPNFGLRPKLGGQISLWTERKDSAKRLIQKVKSLTVLRDRDLPTASAKSLAAVTMMASHYLSDRV